VRPQDAPSPRCHPCRCPPGSLMRPEAPDDPFVPNADIPAKESLQRSPAQCVDLTVGWHVVHSGDLRLGGDACHDLVQHGCTLIALGQT
jgi:hypothetical protein